MSSQISKRHLLKYGGKNHRKQNYKRKINKEMKVSMKIFLMIDHVNLFFKTVNTLRELGSRYQIAIFKDKIQPLYRKNSRIKCKTIAP